MPSLLFPLTLTQSDICLDQIRHHHSPLYNIGGYIEFHQIDIPKLVAAHRQLVRDFDVFGLRVVFTKHDVVQYVSPIRTTSLEIRDLSKEENPVQAADKCQTSLFETAFDITDAELFRAHVLKIGNDHYRYVGLAHHLMMDGWGFSNWAGLLCQLYNDPSKAAGPPFPWREIALDDERYIASEKYLKDKSYWGGRTRKIPPSLFKPRYQHTFAESRKIPSRRKIIEVPRIEFNNLKSLTRWVGAAVPHHLLAMLAVYFASSGQDKLVFGIPCHNRRDHRRKQMLGVFTSISPLFIDMSDRECTFGKLVQNICEQQKADFRHQRYPLGHIIRDVTNLGDRRSLYDVAFNYLQLRGDLSFGEKDAALVYLSHNHEATPLTVTLCEYGECGPVQLQLDYNLAYLSDLDSSLLIDKLSALMLSLHGTYHVRVADLQIPNQVEDVATAAIEHNKGQAVRPRIEVRRRETDEAPLSFAQQRLWFIDQLGGGSVQYNMPGAMRIEGRFEEEVAERSFRRIIERHAPLRTVFFNGAEGPRQRIRSSFDFRMGRMDVSGLGREEQEQVVVEALKADAMKPFDLSADLMLRASFIRLSGEEGVLQFNMHHIASDGWSMGILVREFVQLYEALAAGRPDPLEELAIQYADYAQWQREWLQGEVLERQLLYWEKQLAGVPEVHGLPLDRPRPAVQSFGGAVHALEIEQATLEELKQVARREQATLFMVLQGVFGLLLSRHANSADIVMGTPVANRLQKEVEPLVGFFVNTLILRVDCSGGRSFKEYLEHVKRVNLEAQAHQDVPFEQVVERLKPRRSSSHGALFQIMFSMETDWSAEFRLPGMRVSPLKSDGVSVKFDLMLDAVEHREGLRLSFAYNTDLFAAATIARMGEHLKNLLQGVVASPQAKIEELPLLTEAEREYLLYGLNRTAVEYPRGLCLQELFEAQVERSPEAVAVVFEDQELSYRELNQQANRLAHYLREQGVRPDTLVGLCVERSLEMVVGILGILKAGGGYVPLEPGYPQERLEYMIADSGPAVLLTQASLLERLAGVGVPMLRLDADRKVLHGYAADNPRREEVGQTPRHLAYVIYTSGSTGKPKGVMNEHAGVVNRLLWAREAYEIGSGERILQKTPFSFDVSVWEFLLPLFSGGQLVMARPGGHMDPQYLAEVIERKQITMLHFVPSMLQVFLEYGVKEGSCRGLRRVLCSGEVLSYALQQRFAASLPGVELHNLYGPTEAAIDVTAWLCQPGVHAGVVPIGRPIANIQMYILDEYLQPVPQGVTGELYIGGVGVARGYWNRGELTQERFIEDPYSSTAGARMYRTGDLGRWLGDGAIEYLGRNDHQVKIRGFRIELGEIQTQLEQMEDVKTATVLVRGHNSSDRQIVAYVERKTRVKQTDTDIAWADALQRALRTCIPDYMIPVVTVVDRIPLTSNGKLDTKALLALPEQVRLQGGYMAPTTATEIKLVSLWADLLGVDHERVGVTTSVFDLGGNSLSLVRLANSIRAEMGSNLPLQILFDISNLRDLASRIDIESILQAVQEKMNSSTTVSQGYL